MNPILFIALVGSSFSLVLSPGYAQTPYDRNQQTIRQQQQNQQQQQIQQQQRQLENEQNRARIQQETQRARDEAAQRAREEAQRREAAQQPSSSPNYGTPSTSSGTQNSASQSPSAVAPQGKQSPNDIFFKGYDIFLKRDYRQATPHLQEAVRLDPNNSLYLTILGISYWRGGDPQSAIAPLSKAIDLEPGWQSAGVRMDLAQAYDLLGLKGLAQGHVHQALELVKGREGQRAEIERMWGPLLAKYKPQ